MTQEHTKLLTEYLKAKPIYSNPKILFNDLIDHCRVDVEVFYEPSQNKVYIGGDQGELYEFDELELIDQDVLSFRIPQTGPLSLADSITIIIKSHSDSRRQYRIYIDGIPVNMSGKYKQRSYYSQGAAKAAFTKHLIEILKNADWYKRQALSIVQNPDIVPSDSFNELVNAWDTICSRLNIDDTYGLAQINAQIVTKQLISENRLEFK